MPAGWGRPMDKVVYPPGWSTGAAVFDVDELDPATASGVITQWVLANHIRAVFVVRHVRSVRSFAKEHGLSEDRLHNFLNGNRIARFEDFAVILELLGAGAWPDPARVTKSVEAARARSAKFASKSSVSSTGSSRYLPTDTSMLDAFDPQGTPPANVPHPDSRSVLARFRRWVLAQPAVLSHLELASGEKPKFEIRVVVCDPGEGGCDVWVGAGVIAGNIWVPADWKNRVAPLSADAMFFEVTAHDERDTTVILARIQNSEDGPVDGDVTVGAELTTLRTGDLRWGR